jgi:hypothetical protein
MIIVSIEYLLIEDTTGFGGSTSHTTPLVGWKIVVGYNHNVVAYADQFYNHRAKQRNCFAFL